MSLVKISRAVSLTTPDKCARNTSCFMRLGFCGCHTALLWQLITNTVCEVIPKEELPMLNKDRIPGISEWCLQGAAGGGSTHLGISVRGFIGHPSSDPTAPCTICNCLYAYSRFTRSNVLHGQESHLLFLPP